MLLVSPSKIYTEPESVCVSGRVQVCVCVCASMHARACLTVMGRESASGDSAQSIFRL